MSNALVSAIRTGRNLKSIAGLNLAALTSKGIRVIEPNLEFVLDLGWAVIPDDGGQPQPVDLFPGEDGISLLDLLDGQFKAYTGNYQNPASWNDAGFEITGIVKAGPSSLAIGIAYTRGGPLYSFHIAGNGNLGIVNPSINTGPFVAEFRTI